MARCASAPRVVIAPTAGRSHGRKSEAQVGSSARGLIGGLPRPRWGGDAGHRVAAIGSRSPSCNRRRRCDQKDVIAVCPEVSVTAPFTPDAGKGGLDASRARGDQLTRLAGDQGLLGFDLGDDGLLGWRGVEGGIG